jgi:hypothetical protein
MAIKAQKRAPGAPASARRFKDDATGEEWEAEVEWSEAGDGSPAVNVKVTPPGGGPPLRDGRTFTEETLADPDFDPQAQLSDMVARLIDRGKRVRSVRERVEAARGWWEGEGDFALPSAAPASRKS